MGKKVLSNVQNSKAIIGTFDGECADANITNLNGLDITREVWENVFNSDDYKKAIEYGWYIGYAGHPEDPNYMNFQDACIVMTEGHIDDNGKVYGKFNLLDTPVGRIIKTCIDSGVTFGISVRGAGDIYNNSVDPDTFVFRGFDIVTFPAYPESIPTFTEIAASTDAEARKKYQRICASVDENIEGLNTKESIEVIQSCFAKQSDTYKKLEDRKSSITEACAADEISEEDVQAAKIESLTNLYVEASTSARKLAEENKRLQTIIKQQDRDHRKTLSCMKRIMSSQLTEMDESLADVCKQRKEVVTACQKLRAEVAKHKATIAASQKELTELKQSVTASFHKYESEIDDLTAENKILKDNNLKYKQKIQSSSQAIRDKEESIASLETKLNETVTAARSIETATSNRDAEITSLKSELDSAYKLISEYQDAYANLYASAVGASLNNVSVSCTTSVSQLKQTITASTRIDDSIQPITEVPSIGDDSDGLITL